MFQNDFQIIYAPIKNYLFRTVGPIKFPFLVILMAYVIKYFLKRQFCFPRQKKFSSFLTLLHNPSKFPFLELPEKAIYASPYGNFHPVDPHINPVDH